MGQLRDRMETDLKLGGYSPSTRKIYLLYARLFAKHHMRSPAEMGEAEIRQYLLYMVEEKKISRETYRQIRAALIFLYTVTLKRQTEVEHLPVRRKKVKLPVVLSGTEIKTLLEIPDDWYTCAFVPIGYPIGGGHGPISRRPVAKLAFADVWGTGIK